MQQTMPCLGAGMREEEGKAGMKGSAVWEGSESLWQEERTRETEGIKGERICPMPVLCLCLPLPQRHDVLFL